MNDRLMTNDGKQTRGDRSTSDETDDYDSKKGQNISIGMWTEAYERVDRLERHLMKTGGRD